MNNTFEHITLLKNAPDIIRVIRIIKRLNFIHNIIALIVFAILWWSIIQDKPLNLISYIIVLCASLFGSFVYLGGSIGLRYTSNFWGLTSFSYLLGIEDSQIIMRDDILSIEVEKERFTFPFFVRRKKYIAIRHKNGKIITGGWLDDDEMQDIVKKINYRRA